MNIPQRHRTHRHKQLIGQRINNRPHNRLHVVLSSNVPVNKVGDTRVREQQQRGSRLASSYIVPTNGVVIIRVYVNTFGIVHNDDRIACLVEK